MLLGRSQVRVLMVQLVRNWGAGGGRKGRDGEREGKEGRDIVLGFDASV